MKRYGIILSLSLFGVLGCDTAEEPMEQPPPAKREKPPATAEKLPSMPVDHPDMEQLKVLSRGPRRMSVEQLERSIENIIGVAEGEVELDQNLALTLGEPDYKTVTEESLDPTPLFMKFMMDLGGFVCQAIRDSDPNRPLEERVLTRYTDREENIRHIMLRFTGIEGEAADPYVERLSRVYEAGAAGPNGEVSGWEAVCLAVFTSPEFLLY